MKRWTEKEFSQWVYYDDQDGKIIGAVYKIGNSNSIWGGRVYLVNNTEKVMGQYIDSDYARKSVELYWEIDSRTLLE
jgi:CTP:phosphocholine cytidylyltransferase-like protein